LQNGNDGIKKVDDVLKGGLIGSLYIIGPRLENIKMCFKSSQLVIGLLATNQLLTKGVDSKSESKGIINLSTLEHKHLNVLSNSDKGK